MMLLLGQKSMICSCGKEVHTDFIFLGGNCVTYIVPEYWRCDECVNIVVVCTTLEQCQESPLNNTITSSPVHQRTIHVYMI